MIVGGEEKVAVEEVAVDCGDGREKLVKRKPK